MFDVTSNEIAQLNDTDLRELVGRLCEAELASRGLSTAAVTWGGAQTAADGGLDVRVALSRGTVIDDFVPRASTGFQVKTPDMPRAAILAETRPMGEVRPVIQELANDGGAYIIVSSNGSTADSALRNRRNALRDAVDGIANATDLHTDFYDRTRLATWVRCHPGLITWVKEKIGSALVGWRPYGPWSGAAEAMDAEYLLDDKLRLHLGRHRDAPSQPVAEAIDELRDELAQPGKVVRLIGLSGVGKTRLVQALFDSRIGHRPLPPSLAVYTNLSDNPNPQPTSLASDLIANQTRAVLIIDNCSFDLHRSLSELCIAGTGEISMLTIEYDVRDDQPEGTQVVTLDTSSPELIEKLVQRRYPHLSEVDARTIAENSGGNARIAIALAETVGRSETIAGLSNEELFQRLFRQRHDADNALLRAAQACSLVYSFQGEALTGDEAELSRLALLAGQTVLDTYRHVGELLRRDLIQRRGVWRAVLPHAIANRLAARALEDTPYNLIHQQLVEGGNDRLALSFSRRLSFLHDHPQAVIIVKRWLAADGLLGDLTVLGDLKQTMMENVAPVLPEAALTALERAGTIDQGKALTVWNCHRHLLRSLAYDPTLFERSVSLLILAATRLADEREAKESLQIFSSLFTVYLSGTHATIDQRLCVIEHLLQSQGAETRRLGLAALNEMLEATHFSSAYLFEFGARSRDYGYMPRSDAELTQWYRATLIFVESLAPTEATLQLELRALVAQRFRGLWVSELVHDELERLSRRFAAEGFWRDGWAACRQTIHFDTDQLKPESSSRLHSLENYLRPSNLLDRVRAVVLGDRSGGLDLEDMAIDDDVISSNQRLDHIARDLGGAVAADDLALDTLLPDLLQNGNRTWIFGRGLAAASPQMRTTWTRLVEALEQIPIGQRKVQMLMGFLSELGSLDQELAQSILDEALGQPALARILPVLHSAVGLDERGVDRLKRALRSGQVPVSMFRNLAGGRATDPLASSTLAELLLLIADQPEGFDVASEILFMRFYSDRSEHREYGSELLSVGQEFLENLTFGSSSRHDDHRLAAIALVSLVGPEASPIAAVIAARLRRAVAARETNASDHDQLLKALLQVQPEAVLDALFEGEERDQRAAIRVFAQLGQHRANPADGISCEALINWCERGRENRYPLAASFITFAHRSEQSGPQIWSPQARALLAGSPNPRSVLLAFVERFRPMSWSGSRATLMEANARLLDSMEPVFSAEFTSSVTEIKQVLMQEVERVRLRETEQDRTRDERFE